jgi:hypothetical protein
MQVPSPAVLSSELQLLSTPVPAYGSSRGLSVQSYVRRALNILANSDILAPEKDRLESVVRLALDAQQAYFSAALFHPDERQLDHFFEEFIQLCAIPDCHDSLSLTPPVSPLATCTDLDLSSELRKPRRGLSPRSVPLPVA